ncbi:MAG: general secretion pathway protein GspE [Geobacter sp.]|nr:MAG: general secretion pathway protein GspE [Geobacter sp.]
MAITLLDMLLNAGLISRVQFDDALKNRVIFGGKIGTSLIEMGYISEEELARFLSNKLAVPYVSPKQLLTIPQETIDLLPRDMAIKYGVIPIKLDKKRLSLVMSDPADLKAIDEIGFITGFIVRPLITPEVRLVQALSKYYQADMPPRYQHIIEIIEAQKQASAAPQPQKPASVPPAPAERARTAQPEQPVTAVPTPKVRPKAIQSKPPQQEPAQPEPAAPSESTVRPQRPRPQMPVPEPLQPPEFEEEQDEYLEDLEIVEDVAWSEQIRRFEPDAVSNGLAHAENSDEISDLVITELGRKLRRAAIFRIKDHTAVFWKGFDRKMTITGIDNLRLPLTEPSVLKTVADSAGIYLGPMKETPINHLLYDALGGGQPSAVLLMPILIGGRLVNIVYAEGDEELNTLVPDLQKLLTKATLALEILIFREKILMI